jgi:hypothetical protein
MPDNSLASGRAKPRPGEPFAPAEYGWAVFDAIERAKGLSEFEKRLCVRLMRLAGPKTWCWATTGWLAEQLGKSRRMVVYAIARLAAEKYLRRERRGARGTVFRFLWRPEYETSQSDSGGMEQSIAQPAKLRNELRRNCAMGCAGIAQSIAHLYNTKNTINTNKSARASENSEPDGFDASELFERIWTRHPKKVKRYLAAQALVQALTEAPDPEALAGRIERIHEAWSKTEDWTKQNGRYAPQLHHWLIEKRWLDGEPAPADEEPVVPYRPYWEVEAESHG